MKVDTSVVVLLFWANSADNKPCFLLTYIVEIQRILEVIDQIMEV